MDHFPADLPKNSGPLWWPQMPWRADPVRITKFHRGEEILHSVQINAIPRDLVKILLSFLTSTEIPRNRPPGGVGGKKLPHFTSITNNQNRRPIRFRMRRLRASAAANLPPSSLKTTDAPLPEHRARIVYIRFLFNELCINARLEFSKLL